jgi:hypothetical protein
MDGTRDHVKQDRPRSERQILHVLTHMWNLDQKEIWHDYKDTVWCRMTGIGDGKVKAEGKKGWVL